MGELLGLIRRSSQSSRRPWGVESRIVFLLVALSRARYLVVLLVQTCWVGVWKSVQSVGRRKMFVPLSLRRSSRQNLASGRLELGRGTLKLGWERRFLFTALSSP